MDKEIKSISVFFPAWNEWGTIGSLIAIINRILEKNNILDNEIIVIDNGSTDNTKDLLEEFKKRFPNVKVVSLHPNQGYGGALKAGFETASKDFVFFVDADIQVDINELDTAINLAKDDVDVIAGYRKRRKDLPHRILLGKMYNWLARRMFKLKTKDIDCDFRLIRNELMKDISLEEKDGLICVELMRKIEDRTDKMRQIPVEHYQRVSGTSKFFDAFQVFRTLNGLFKLRKKLMGRKKFPKFS